MSLLSRQQEFVVRELAKEYYTTNIQLNNFVNKERLFGIEIEFSLVDEFGNLNLGVSEKISDELNYLPVVPELGSYQIETNPLPLPLVKGSFKQLHSLLKNVVGKMNFIGEKYDSLLFPIGLPLDLFQNLDDSRIYTTKERYLLSSNFIKKYGSGSSIDFENGGGVFLPAESGVTLINELHIQLQATSSNDVIDLFNYSQMLTSLFVSLGANSGMHSSQKLLNLEHQIKIFESCEGFFDGKEGISRVGLFPGYISSLDDYFDVALSFRPIYPSKNNFDAFNLMLGTYYGWTRIRHGMTPSPHLRIEFRPLSTQPTLIENIALAEFYVMSLLYASSEKIQLLPEHALRYNFDASIKHGMDANLFWIFDGELGKHNVSDILNYFFSNVGEGEFINVMKPRIEQFKSPVNRLIEERIKLNNSNYKHDYLCCFKTDSPYIY